MLERYFFEGKSIIHRLDPRVKIAVSGILILIVAFSYNFKVIYFVLLYALVVLLIARLPFLLVMKRLSPPIIFIFLLWLFLPFSVEGERLFSLGPLTFTKEGVVYTYILTVKTLTILLLLVSFVSTSSMIALFHALAHFKVPKKLVFLIFFTYRYIHVVWHEYQRMKNAMLIRCFIPRTNLHTYKTIAYMLGMLIVRSYDRSERVYKAMLCRGFNGTFYMLDHFKIARLDIIFTAVSILFVTGISWLLIYPIL